MSGRQRNPVGTHVEVGPGLVKGTLRAAREIGAEVLEVFTGNPRGWALSEGKAAEDAEFRRQCAEDGIRVVVHAPYLVDLGSPTPATYERSVASVAHDLDRVVEIGGPGPLRLVHADDSADPCGSMRDRHARIGEGHPGARCVEELLAHPATDGVPFVLETPGSRDADDGQLALVEALR